MAREATYVQQDEILHKVDTEEARQDRASTLVKTGQKDAINSGLVFGSDRKSKKVTKSTIANAGFSNLNKKKTNEIDSEDSFVGPSDYQKSNVNYSFSSNRNRVSTSKKKQSDVSSRINVAELAEGKNVKYSTSTNKRNYKSSKHEKKTKTSKWISLKSASTTIASGAIDVMGESEEFDDAKKYKNKLSTANQVRNASSKISQTIKARKAKQVAEGVKAAEKAAKASRAAALSSSKASAAAASKSATTAGTGVACTAGMPVILVVLLALLGIAIVIAVFSILTSLMGTKNNTGSLTGVEKEIAAALMAEGYNKIHVAAIMGNMSAESSFNSKALQEGGERENLSGEERSNWQGYGLNQMTSGRKENMCNLAESRNTSHCDIGSQVAYFCTPAEKAESNWNKSRWKAYDCVPISRGEWERMNDGLDILTTALMAFWERPNEDPAINHIDKRKSEAWRIYNALNSSGGDGTIVGEAQAIADDDSHGYNQDNRDLNPDVDCSSFVFYSLQHAGYGLSGSPFSTRDMRDRLLPLGFQEIGYTGLSGCVEGDVLWHSGHTEIYAGGGQSVGAHGDYDGRPGDSSGTEVNRGSADQGWSLVYRAPAK